MQLPCSAPTDEIFGTHKLRKLALDARHTPEEICTRVIEFSAHRYDDAALLAISLDPTPELPT
jgi:hypothetical protein